MGCRSRDARQTALGGLAVTAERALLHSHVEAVPAAGGHRKGVGSSLSTTSLPFEHALFRPQTLLFYDFWALRLLFRTKDTIQSMMDLTGGREPK